MKLRHLLLGVTALVAPTTIWAQSAPPADGASADSDEIVVTARKREENLQDVPIAITALDSTEIKSARIERLSDVAKLTSGLVFTPLFGRQNQLPIIRGAAQTFGQLNVGVFLDGIYLSGKGGVDLELNDLQRVEIVKGPQSALYGRNTFAGAINYVTQRPTADFSGRAEATVGDNGLYKIIGSVSGPLSDKIRFRVGGFYKKFDGFYKSGIDGGKVDFEESYGGIGTLEIKPTEELTATFRVSYAKNDDGQPASSVIRTNAGFGTPSGGSATQQRNLLYIGQVPVIPQNGVTVNTGTVAGLPGGRYGDREEAVRASATFEYDFGNAVGTSISSYSYRKAEYTYDGDNTICDVAAGCPNFGFPFAPAIPVNSSQIALSSNDGYLRDYSQEFRIASSGKRKIDWLMGVFYYGNTTSGIDRGLSPTATSGATAYSAFNPNYSFPRTTLKTDSYSVFGSATWHVTDQFSITGELRYEYEQQSFRQCPTYYANTTPATVPGLGVAECGAVPSPIPSTTSTFTGSQTVFPSPVGTAPTTAFFGTDQDFHFTTPRLILNYKATPDVLVYASFARGAKTGGFNTGLNVFPNQRTYQPEYSDNFELGLKSDLFDRKLRFNLAAYYINWRDQQAACQNPVTAGGSSTNRTYTCNVAASKVYGLEADMTARFTDWFTLTANYSYTHARYSAFVDDSLQANLVLAGLPAITFDGKSLPYVPDHKFLISPRINIPLGGISIEARADLQYQSKTFVRADNLQSFGDKTTLDLRLGTTIGNFSIQAFANNVLNDRTPVAAVRFFDSVNYSVSAPLVSGANLRQIGVSVGAKF
jgi:iron complex outermembrane receptor protein